MSSNFLALFPVPSFLPPLERGKISLHKGYCFFKNHNNKNNLLFSIVN